MVAKNYILVDQHDNGKWVPDILHDGDREKMPDCKSLSMKDVIKEVTFALMQRGAPMRMREASHPQPATDLSQLHGWKSGKKVRLDLTRQAVAEEGHHQESWTEYRILRRLQKKQT